MHVIKLFLALLVVMLSCEAATTSSPFQYPPEDHEILNIRRTIIDLALGDEADSLRKQLDAIKETNKVTDADFSKIIWSALYEAVMNQSNSVVKLLLDHPLCTKPYVRSAYEIARDLLRGETETKAMLKTKFKQFPGIDLDLLSDDDEAPE
jgi:hypothetical protein